jgi:hypothetical protein
LKSRQRLALPAQQRLQRIGIIGQIGRIGTHESKATRARGNRP